MSVTLEETIRMLEAKAECNKRETSGTDSICNNRECDECDLNYMQGNMKEQREALYMAISALKAQDSETKRCATCKHKPPSKKWPCADCDMREPADRWEKQDVPVTNVHCKDTIYRQAAIDAVISLCDDCDSGYCGSCRVNFLGEKDARKVLEDLPSAQPDGIPIEWIDKHLEWLDNCDNDFAQLAKVGIRAMVELWKKDRI